MICPLLGFNLASHTDTSVSHMVTPPSHKCEELYMAKVSDLYMHAFKGFIAMLQTRCLVKPFFGGFFIVRPHFTV